MTLNENQIKSLAIILAYIKDNEYEHYLEFIEENKPDNHVYYHAIELSKAFIK
jgi:hypothetical protein